MNTTGIRYAAVFAALLALGLASSTAEAKEKVRVGFIGPLSGGTSSNGLGGRNSADLAVQLRNGFRRDWSHLLRETWRKR